MNSDKFVSELEDMIDEAVAEATQERDNSPTQEQVAAGKSFAKALAHQPTPDITVDNDGDLSFEWYSVRGVLELSIDGERYLSYAGLGDDLDMHGSCYFTGELPDEVREAIQRVALETTC